MIIHTFTESFGDGLKPMTFLSFILVLLAPPLLQDIILARSKCTSCLLCFKSLHSSQKTFVCIGVFVYAFEQTVTYRSRIIGSHIRHFWKLLVLFALLVLLSPVFRFRVQFVPLCLHSVLNGKRSTLGLYMPTPGDCRA